MNTTTEALPEPEYYERKGMLHDIDPINDPTFNYQKLYTSTQMHAYAAKCCAERDAEIERLKAHVVTYIVGSTNDEYLGRLERFAALVEKEVKREAGFDRANLWMGRINEAIKQEREECADLCESHIGYPSSLYFADTIRARSNK